jgi:sugar phosphate permease
VYQLDVGSLRAARTLAPGAGGLPWLRVSRTVLLLGIVSCFTDISSEMVASILPIYLLTHLQFSPIQFGVVDGLYQGVGAVARLASGMVADRWQQYKAVAAVGYGLSAICKLGLLVAGTAPGAVATIISVDRTGKGLRTAPRDALISLSARASNLAASVGVHRTLDTAGVIGGPLVAFFVLRAVPDGFDMVFVLSFAAAIVGLGVLVLLVEDAQERTTGAKPSMRMMLAATLAPELRPIVATGILLSVTVP